MKMKKSFPNLMLVILLAVVLAVCRIVKVCVPFWIVPELNIPNMVLLCGAALVLDYYWNRGTCPVNLWMPVLAALAFGMLPLAAGFAGVKEALKLALLGAVVFTACAWVFDSMEDRLTSGPAAKAAPVLSVLVLYLAAQCFTGIL